MGALEAFEAFKKDFRALRLPGDELDRQVMALALRARLVQATLDPQHGPEALRLITEGLPSVGASDRRSRSPETSVIRIGNVGCGPGSVVPWAGVEQARVRSLGVEQARVRSLRVEQARIRSTGVERSPHFRS